MQTSLAKTVPQTKKGKRKQQQILQSKDVNS